MPFVRELPAYLQIEPAGFCNLRCEMCAIRVRQDNRPAEGQAYMRPDLFRAIVDQCEGLERLHLQGLGEPLLNPHFFPMVSYAAARGVQVSVSSNLTLLDARAAALCVESGLEVLHVSVDGAETGTYESIRVGSSFSRLLGNLELLFEAKRLAGSSRPSVRMTVVLMRKNLGELADLVRLASDFGLEEVFVQHLCHSCLESTLPPYYEPIRTFVRRESVEEAPPGRVRRRFREARVAAAACGVRLRLPPLDRRREKESRTPPLCDWPWTGLYVTYQGYVMPCCMVSTPDRINFGSLREQSVAELWNSDVYQSFRTRLATNDPPEICASCSIYAGTF